MAIGLTDKQLGYQHGRNGNEAKYPNNANYAAGYVAGCAAFMRELDAIRPLEDTKPCGINDAHIDQYYA